MLIFFPYRAQIALHKTPVLTLGIMLLCLVLYVAQVRSEREVAAHAATACAAAGQAAQVYRDAEECQYRLLHIYANVDAASHLDWHVDDIRQTQGAEAAAAFRMHYTEFARTAPADLTRYLLHEVPGFNPRRMLTASISHGSWEHVIFNCIFFFAFGATVELLLGPVRFLASVVLLALGVCTIDSLLHLGQKPFGTLGLSGVVMGMLGLFLYFLPRAKIAFAYWVFSAVGTFALPVWFVGLWYIGGDIYHQYTDEFTRVNHIGHLAGAFVGVALGATLFRQRREWAQQLELDDPARMEGAGFVRQLEAYLSLPTIMGVMALAYLALVLLIVFFVTTLWVQILLIAPIAVALWQLYRMKKAGRPDWARYQEALALLDQGRPKDAARVLEKLAAAGYPRAQYALATLHQHGRGMLKNPQQAAHWFEQAARRGHADALYQLGILHFDGRGVRQDTPKAIAYYQKAAAKGHAHAAFALGHLFETGPANADGKPDKTQAGQWYYKAGRLFLKEKNRPGRAHRAHGPAGRSSVGGKAAGGGGASGARLITKM